MEQMPTMDAENKEAPQQESAWDEEKPKLSPEEEEDLVMGKTPHKKLPKKFFRFPWSNN